MQGQGIHQADKLHAGEALHAKKEWGWEEEERTGNGAVGGRGDGEMVDEMGTG